MPISGCLTAAEELPGAIAVLIANAHGIRITAPYGRDWLDAALDICRNDGRIGPETAQGEQQDHHLHRRALLLEFRA